jgi:uncharacterized damage-inducible protein DinB
MVVQVPSTGGEKASLKAALDRHREVVLWKVRGLDDEQLRRPVTPSGTTLLGLVKHLAYVEAGWFCATFGRPAEVLASIDETDPESDLRVAPGESTADIHAYYDRSRVAADQVIEEVGIEELGTSWQGDAVSLRWVLIHMVEEVARHAGHLDIVRELIDGVTGYHDRD